MRSYPYKHTHRPSRRGAASAWHHGLVLVLILGTQGYCIADGSFEAGVRRSMLEASQRIQSLRCRYRITMSEEEYLERTIALKSPLLYREDSIHLGPKIQREMNVSEQITYVVRDQCVIFYPASRTIIEGPWDSNESIPPSLGEDIFLIASGVWPLTGRKGLRPYGHPHMLVDVASCPDFVCGDRAGLVDGRRCAELRYGSGEDRLWVDLERGCCAIRREIYDRDSGLITSRYSLSDHRHLGDGIWLPFHIRRQEYDSRIMVSPHGRQAPLLDIDIVVEHADVNSVSDEHFAFAPPPGALDLNWNGEPKRVRQVKPGGLDLLDEQAAWIGAHFRSANWIRDITVRCIVALSAAIAVGLIYRLWLVQSRDVRESGTH